MVCLDVGNSESFELPIFTAPFTVAETQGATRCPRSCTAKLECSSQHRLPVDNRAASLLGEIRDCVQRLCDEQLGAASCNPGDGTIDLATIRFSASVELGSSLEQLFDRRARDFMRVFPELQAGFVVCECRRSRLGG